MTTQWRFEGHAATIEARSWPIDTPRYAAVLVHGYGEHIGRYEYVADFLNRHGAAVYGLDHVGHGRSAGERVVITDYDQVVADVRQVVLRARAEHPGLPVVLIGHSMGGMIAARYAQLHGEDLRLLVLSGPVIGSWEPVTSLLELDEIPFEPIDVSTLSRDAEIGRVYADDPLVWHGPFKRELVAALDTCLKRINAGPKLESLPLLWVHGEADTLVPLEPSRAGVAAIRGADYTEHRYPQARHEVFNETNKDEVLGDVARFIDDHL